MKEGPAGVHGAGAGGAGGVAGRGGESAPGEDVEPTGGAAGGGELASTGWASADPAERRVVSATQMNRARAPMRGIVWLPAARSAFESIISATNSNLRAAKPADGEHDEAPGLFLRATTSWRTVKQMTRRPLRAAAAASLQESFGGPFSGSWTKRWKGQ
jgi:hypothetical protein